MNLADRCNDEGGRLFVSMARIAVDCDMSRSQAQRYVRSLIDDGLLSVVANGAGGAPGSVPHYQIHIDRLAPSRTAKAPPQVEEELTGSTGATGSLDATGSACAQEGSHGCMGGVAPVRQTGSTGATQTVINRNRTVGEPKKTRASKSRSLPEDFAISERVQAWAAEKGFGDLDDHLEHFVGYAKANGKRYADWDQAFMNAVRGNWAKVPGQGLNSQELLEKRNRAVGAKWLAAGAAIFDYPSPETPGEARERVQAVASSIAARAAEPAWRTEQRARTHQAAPGVAAGNPGIFSALSDARHRANDAIEAEARDVPF
ncbi:hypothetical protein [Variovorax sp. UC74_104]|uniref:hypothetical protein n=1 Tax=Variovorax sp. UC74_104 TaxID=3374555 RepID=UPI0037575CE3